MKAPLCQHLAKLSDDGWLTPFRGVLEQRRDRFQIALSSLKGKAETLSEGAAAEFEFFGLHRDTRGNWIFREWAPNATKITLVGDFSGWQIDARFALKCKRGKSGIWEIKLPRQTLRHGMHYELFVEWPDGSGKRLPSYANFVTQDAKTNIFTAEVYAPENPYQFRYPTPPAPDYALIYEAHAGMAEEEEKVGSFREFSEKILPRIAQAGYNTVQLMAVMSHPYYGSFGYHVANFFSIASRFGTPDDFKTLVDRAHALGLRVIMDLVHSHAVRNEVEGLGRFDGTREQYFYPGARGEHAAWDSLCFNYEKPEVLKFLLSNCRYYLEEYHVDGFRFDGVTSMLYTHHGLGKNFSGYADYFGSDVDEAACTYLALANTLIHEVRPDAITVAEDVSGMPGLGAPVDEGGMGFDYRLAMGVTDYWFKLFDLRDEDWSMNALYGELTNRRRDERTISYVECHDQAIVGGQTAMFRLAGGDLYTKMRRFDTSDAVRRAVALHKMARLVTAATGSYGYLNFMGNEFGHPEWIDFPREGNGWSYHYARRQWSLRDNPELFYRDLGDFDEAMLKILKSADLWRYPVHRIKVDDGDKIIAFERGGLWFFANFHCTQSWSDYGVGVMPGKYELVLDSDSEKFGGMGRVAPGQSYFTEPTIDGNQLRHWLKLYLPTRTALVLRKLD